MKQQQALGDAIKMPGTVFTFRIHFKRLLLNVSQRYRETGFQ